MVVCGVSKKGKSNNGTKDEYDITCKTGASNAKTGASNAKTGAAGTVKTAQQELTNAKTAMNTATAQHANAIKNGSKVPDNVRVAMKSVKEAAEAVHTVANNIATSANGANQVEKKRTLAAMKATLEEANNKLEAAKAAAASAASSSTATAPMAAAHVPVPVTAPADGSASSVTHVPAHSSSPASAPNEYTRALQKEIDTLSGDNKTRLNTVAGNIGNILDEIEKQFNDTTIDLNAVDKTVMDPLKAMWNELTPGLRGVFLKHENDFWKRTLPTLTTTPGGRRTRSLRKNRRTHSKGKRSKRTKRSKHTKRTKRSKNTK